MKWGELKGEVELLALRGCDREFVHYDTKYVYTVATESVWCSACRVIWFNFSNVIHMITIKGHTGTKEEIDFYEKYKEQKNPLAYVNVFWM